MTTVQGTVSAWAFGVYNVPSAPPVRTDPKPRLVSLFVTGKGRLMRTIVSSSRHEDIYLRILLRRTSGTVSRGANSFNFQDGVFSDMPG